MSCINNSGNINETFIIESQQYDAFVTGFTLNNNIIILSQNRTDEYSAFTISLSAYTGTSIGLYLPLSGGTVTGTTNFTDGLNTNTIFANTYLNLPIDVFVTGGTYSASTITFTNNTGGTFDITGITTSTPFTGGTVSGATQFTGGLNANTISATTYLNLPNDVFVTGGTYNPNTGVVTFTNNSGTTFNVSGFTSGLTDTVISSFTYTSSANTFTIRDSRNSAFTATLTSVSGLTVNGTLSATTISGGTFYGNGGNLIGIQNIYTSDGTINSNRNVTLNNNSLLFNSVRTGGTAMQLSVTQTQANDSDTGDVAFSLGHVLSGNNLGTELVTRVFALSTSNESTNTSVFNMRVFNLAMNTTVGSVTDELSAIYIENGNTGGAVTTGRGVYINNGLQANNQVGFNVRTLNGTNNTGLLLFEEFIPTGNWGVYVRTHKNYFENSVFVGTSTDSGYKLDVNGKTRISYLSTAFTDSPLIIKNTDPSAFVSNVISFDCDATGVDQPVFMNFAGPNPKGFGFYASDNPITATPDGAAFQLYKNTSSNFPGSVFFDSAAHDNAAIRFRTAPTSGIITERMRITSQGNVGIGTSNPNTTLHVLRGAAEGMNVGFYESAVIQNSGDTKFGVYTNTASFGGGGSSIALGYSNTVDNDGYYPGFEFQHSGSNNPASNFVRYNFLQRIGNGQVDVSSSDLFNIYSDGRVVLNSTSQGTSFPVESKFGIKVNNPVTTLDVRGGGYLGFGTPTVYAGTLHVLEIGATGTSAPLSLNGGSATVEIWSDNPAPYNLPTTGVMFGAAAPGTPADGDFHFSTYNRPTSWSDRVIIKNNTGYVGIATTSITNTLHVSAATNPLRLEGLTSNTSNNLILSVNSSGVVQTYPLTAITSGLSVTGEYLPLSGGTVTGRTSFISGLTANTISATSYSNLPNTLYTGDGVLASNRTVNLSSFTLNFSSSTASNNLVLSSGNVGIGTSSPQHPLHIVTAESIIRFTNADAGGAFVLSGDTGIPRFDIGSVGSGVFSFGVVATGITASGYTSRGNPGDAFIRASVASDGLNIINATDGTKSDHIRFYAGKNVNQGDPDMHINGSGTTRGFVGINVSSATNRLHVSASTDPVRFVGLTATTTDNNLLTVDLSGVVHTYAISALTSTTLYSANGTLSSNRIVNLSSFTLNFSSSTNPNTLVMSGGNVGIGTSTPTNKLEISGTVRTTSDTRLANSSGNVLIGPTPSSGVYSGGTIPSTLTINSVGNSGISFLRPTDFALMSAMSVPDGASLRIGGGNQNFVDIFCHINQVARFSNSTVNGDIGAVGIGTTSPANRLHVSASTDPVRFVGLTSATDNNLLTVDSNGVVHTIAVSSITSSSSADTYVTGFTLSSNTITLSQNRTGQFSAFTISLSAYTGTSSVSGAFLPLSGGTVSGSVFFTSAVTANILTVTGNTRLASVTGNTLNLTSLTGTTDRFVQVNSGGTVSASINIISAYISSASTAATLLSNGNNWDIYGVYTGTAISGTSMGQKHYDDNYFYEAVADNTFIRLIRG